MKINVVGKKSAWERRVESNNNWTCRRFDGLPASLQCEILKEIDLICLLRIEGVEDIAWRWNKGSPYSDEFRTIWQQLPDGIRSYVEPLLYKNERSAEQERRDVESRLACTYFLSLVSEQRVRVVECMERVGKLTDLTFLWIFPETPNEERFKKIFPILPQWARDIVMAELYKGCS